MARQPEGPPPPPTVQKLRIRYAKRGRLRFTSHRDFQRAFERALRRAQVPVAYSAGFSPHPKVSYAGAAPTGVASEAEYLEVAVSQAVDPAWLRAALDAALPAGLDVLHVVAATGPASLADRLEASEWEIRLDGVAVGEADQAARRFVAEQTVPVSRLTKNGVRTFDAREPVMSLEARADRDVEGTCAILRLVVRHVTPAVRPDDVLTGLRLVADLVPPTPPLVTRLAQGPLDVEAMAVSDPLAADRDTGPAAGESVTTASRPVPD
jgi:radical SAM-linked protein